MATTELIFLPFLTSSPLRCTSSLLLHVWYLDINGHISIQKESLCALPVLVACFLCVLMLQKCSHHFQVSRWDVFRSSKAMNGPIGPIGLNVSISSRIKFCEHVKNFPIQKDLLFIFQQLIADTHTHIFKKNKSMGKSSIWKPSEDLLCVTLSKPSWHAVWLFCTLVVKLQRGFLFLDSACVGVFTLVLDWAVHIVCRGTYWMHLPFL